MKRRDFVKTAAAGAAAGAVPALTVPPTALSAAGQSAAGQSAATPAAATPPTTSPPAPATPAAPAVHTRATRPVLVADVSAIRFRNGGPESAIERAFRGIAEGEEILDACVAGVNIPELDPEETGIGYGGLPNADGVVQLDACLMHGPRRWAGGVAGLEGVKTPSLVAKAVAELTDHHLVVGEGAQEFARALGFEIHDDLNTAASRGLWLEWRRRVDPEHWLDPDERRRGAGRVGQDPPGRMRRFHDAALEAGLSMVDDGLVGAESFWGTTSLEAVSPDGDICGVTTTSGLSWKIPGRAGDSPILGAGQYVDNDVGAAGSTGRGEANLYNLSCFMIVEFMRQGMSPKDAGLAVLRRVRDNTVESRLRNSRGLPAFDLRFFIVNKAGEYAGVAMYGSAESAFAVCDENGAREEPLEGLLEGSPRD